MLKTKIRLLLIALLLSIQLVTFSGNAYAKQGTWTGDQWDNPSAEGFSFGPPTFSVHPIHSPEDIPAFRAEMKKFVEDLREYIRNFVEAIKANTP